MQTSRIKILVPCIALISVIAFSMLLCLSVNAASGVTVDLIANTARVKPGETITVQVTLNNFPNLTRFGPIEVYFDNLSVSYIGMVRGAEMPSTFSINNSASKGVIAITGIDETVENQIVANQTAPTADENGNPLNPPEDTSMFQTDRVVLCELQFEVLDSAKGEARFWISNVAGFRNSSLEQVSATIGSLASVPVDVQVSSDASLSSLSINGATLEPAFSPSLFTYKASVARNVTDIVVTASPYHISSQVFISGQSGLKIGANEIKITVLAQDMITSEVYTITVTRMASYVPPGATITSAEGKTYSFAELPDDLSLPSDFFQGAILLEGVEVPAFQMAGLKDVLLYLQDGASPAGLYVYSPETGSVFYFDANNAFFRSSQLLTVISLPENESPPDGFVAGEVSFRGKKVSGFVSENGRSSLLYMKDDTGKAVFYYVDGNTNDVYPFVASEKINSPLFFMLFLVFLFLSIAEAAMIVIIFRLRRRKPRTQTPNLRRV